jgi:hypothetical protein
MREANNTGRPQDALDHYFQVAVRQSVVSSTPTPHVWRRIKRRLDQWGGFDLLSTSLLNASFFTCPPDLPSIDRLHAQYYFIGYSVRPL